jgi:hypothetical protein
MAQKNINKNQVLKGNTLKEYKKTLTFLTQEQDDILVGTLLGDASIFKGAKNNPSYSPVKWEQKASQKDYIFHLYNKFKTFITTPPKIRTIKACSNIKERQSYLVTTFSHPLFSYYKDILYTMDTCNIRRKIIPENIGDYLTPRALAYWYMDDGYKDPYGFRISTQNFTYEEHLILKKTFWNKYGINITIREAKTKWKGVEKIVYYIYIPANDRDKFLNLIKAYILPSFQYKILFKNA